MTSMRMALSLILLVLAPALLMQAPATLGWVPGIAIDELPLTPQYKQVVICVNLLGFFAREFYHFVDKGEMPSEEACRVLQALPAVCRRRLDVFLNLPLQQSRNIKLTCHNRLLLGNQGAIRPIVPSPLV